MTSAGGDLRAQASVRQLFSALGEAQRIELLDRFGADAVISALSGTGTLRMAQLPPPGAWTIWTILAGRGFGKTRAGAEWVHGLAAERPRRFALVGASLEAARTVMVEGESGLLARAPEGLGVEFLPSLHQLNWENGSQARLFSGGDPDGLRGGQFDFAWGDEFAHWPRAEAALTNLRLATRLGEHPQLLLTTTPLPLPWLRALLSEPGVVVTRGRMRDNRANLPEGFLAALQARYGGTAVGRQEIDGEIIDSLEGALWSRGLLERQRRQVGDLPPLVRVVVAVDPPAGGVAAVCGIVVAGLDGEGRGWVLEDASLAGARPELWAQAVVEAAERHGADRVIAEINNGGDMVTSVLRAVDAVLPIQTVRAARGKVARAEPVASLYAQGRVFHMGSFPDLEDQLCGLMANGIYGGPGASPDRADALVWALTALLLGPRRERPGIRSL
ncbi:phage terminase large subunit-like protein [Polymorphobacter multimanifer]|uniref:Phage terminase large subunit-like protein n=1 Tax=Polymorphobacter multimanifer TaxID=1070431 RepID=A0A841L2U2_9SPHN|nr:terminase family protein [Polymorphobacter multimanifer]MBB6226616.1 phage terminase large subunit-like protein [Polymorphobacter multimanifer]